MPLKNYSTYSDFSSRDEKEKVISVAFSRGGCRPSKSPSAIPSTSEACVSEQKTRSSRRPLSSDSTTSGLYSKSSLAVSSGGISLKKSALRNKEIETDSSSSSDSSEDEVTLPSR